MKSKTKETRKTAVVLSTLNGKIDLQGNIIPALDNQGWNLISDQNEVTHSMMVDPSDNLYAKHQFVNTSNEDVLLRWSIHIITTNGQHIKYDFGTLVIRAGAIQNTKSVPYKCSRMLAAYELKNVLVAMLLV